MMGLQKLRLKKISINHTYFKFEPEVHILGSSSTFEAVRVVPLSGLKIIVVA